MKEMKMKGDVCLFITTDKTIRNLNLRFAKKNKPTDVLSFPLKNIFNDYIGDIAISIDRAKKQALMESHSVSTEIKYLLLHGLIHLKGFDHVKDGGTMNRLELKMRKRLNLVA